MKKYKTLYLLVILFAIMGFTSQAQDVVISGVVVDKDTDSSLPGVNIVITILDPNAEEKGKYKMIDGTITDAIGKFRIKVPINCKLKFSFVGYIDVIEDITVAKSDYKIFMPVQNNMTNDVVIIGYQEKRKSDVTGSNFIIESKDLMTTPVQNVMELLQGRVPGLNIQQNNGTPGMAGSYVIRGISDINTVGEGDNMYLTDNSPLFVVDGFPVLNASEYSYEGLVAGSNISPLSMIPQEDIDNIQILKDASATALYGSAGAYGVILINTKRGSSLVPVISYNGSVRISTPPRLRDVLAGTSERQLRIKEMLENEDSRAYAELLINSNPAFADSLNVYYNNNTDWQDVFYRTTYNQSHNLNCSGASDVFNYKVNLGYYEQKGIIDNTGFTRYSLRTNMGYMPNKKFKMTANVNTNIGINSTGSGNALVQTGVADGANTSSLLPPPSLYTASNSALSALSVDNDNKNLGYDAGLNLTYRLTDAWSVNSTIGYSYSNKTEDNFVPGMLNNEQAKLTSNNSFRTSVYNRNSISWRDRFGLFQVGMTIQMEVTSRKESGNYLTLGGLPSDKILGPGGYVVKNSEGQAESTKEYKTLSFTFAPSFGIGSPTIGGNKYVFNPSIRPDASSVSGSGKRWTINPGLGFRWNFHMEPFMERFSPVSTGSFRISWGRTIRQNANIYDIYGRYYIHDDTYSGQSVIPINRSSIPNPDLEPTTNTSWNFGGEMGFLNNRYRFDIDTYYKQTDNILKNREIANHNGFDGMRSTETSLVNYGLEVSLQARPLPARSKLDWNMSFNFAINKDKLTALPNSVRQITSGSDNPVVNRVGSNALSNYLYIYQGVYESDEEVPVDPATGLRYRVGGNNTEDAFFRAGDPKWLDVNGDYVLDDNDRKIVGNSQAQITGGFYTSLRYGPLTLSTSLSFTLRRDVINKTLADEFRTYYKPEDMNALVPIDAYDFWTPNHRVAKYPNPFDYKRASVIDPFRSDQTLFQEDGSFLKINGISSSYRVNKKHLERIGISSMTFTLSVNNVWVISKYSGVNPENVNSLGRDVSGGYPNSRDYSFGVNVQF